ncbi:MAG: AI-2E family transporter [Solirubrobacteraceae bacterium]|jgi:predicted PurR-regulated permease PerM
MASATPSTRSIAKIFFTVVALAGLTYLLYLLRSILGLLCIAVFLAAALGPAVDFFARRRLPRPLAILLVYVLILVGIFGVGLLIVPPIASQVQQLSRDIPGYLQDLQRNPQFRRYDQKYGITAKLTEQARSLPSRLADAAGALQAVTVGVFGAVVQLVTVLTIVFFLLLDGARLADFAFRLLRPEHQRRYRALAADIYGATAGYVAGNLAISIMAGTTTYVTLALLGVPFAIPLAVLMAFLDLIPLVGATIAGVVVGLVTLFVDFPTATLVWIAVFVLYQQLENNVLQPVVYRRTVNVPPLVVIVAVLAGGSLLGVLGALMAIPVAAAIQIFVRDAWRLRHQPRVPPDAAPPPDEPGAAPPPEPA